MKRTSAKISKPDLPSASESSRTPRARFTFHGNVRDTRYGWLRLTPAYSVHLVRELLESRARPELPVLDPFCGTGTTLLTCAELGIPCATLDVNPFLVWLARAKTARYGEKSRARADALITDMSRAAVARGNAPWLPALHQIEKWWAKPALHALGRAFSVLQREDSDESAQDLAKLAFCRSLITCANVSFGHQSMSFVQDEQKAVSARQVSLALREAFTPIAKAAALALPKSPRRVHLGDARSVAKHVGKAAFGSVITSPPYANRMSYVRELRPYMYWLGYLERASDAGELDWRAIGGTWGSATSRVAAWQSEHESPLRELDAITARIAHHSDVLARYVAKYFVDMLAHVASLSTVVARGGEVHYVVGNSKFFDVVLPVERIFAEIFELCGFQRAKVTTLRKRTSKPELYEFLVSATRRLRSRRASERAILNRVSRALSQLSPLPLLLVLVSCAPSMPPRWAEGGAPLLIAPAQWQRGDDDPVEIKADGRVFEGDKLRFTIDRVGRVTNEDYDAFALLLPDGHVVGTDDHALGYVGVNNASPPFSGQAWLSLLPDGRVVFFHPDGDRGALGQWTGCNGPNRRTCTLVTQMFLVQNLRVGPPMYGPTFGVGVGVGVGF